MNRIFACLTGIFTLITGFTTHAQIRPKEEGKSLLWRISGKQIQHPSYLFGTIHLVCPEDYIWTPRMDESLQKSSQVCFEMALNDPNIMMQVAAGLIDMSGKKLEDYFTADQFKLLKQYVTDTLGMDIAMFENLKPVALQTMIGTSALGCNNPVSYEDSIMKTAQAAQKPILGLEDPQEQLAVLESIPVDTVIAQLMDELQNNKNYDTDYTKLVNAYKTQDLPLLFHLITTSNELGDDMGRFLDDRNKKWIARMTEKMQLGSIFFAVGAGHLWGDNGVISLLRHDGYTVVPLR